MKLQWIVLFLLLAILLSACAVFESQTVEEGVTPIIIETATATEEPTKTSAPTRDIDNNPPAGAEREFITDFFKHTVSYLEIQSGGTSKDGILSIDFPEFISVQEADPWLANVESIIFVQVGEDARVYPIQVLIWHEIVNDTVGNKPLAITFCPLCNTAIVFEREVDGQVLDFGTTGRLHKQQSGHVRPADRILVATGYR